MKNTDFFKGFEDPAIKKLFLFSLGFHIVTAWFSGGFYQFDEHFQILEFLNWKIAGNDSQILPWEFKHKMRPGLQVYIYWSITKVMHLLGITSPFIISFVLRLLSSIIGWLAIVKLTQISFKWFTNRKDQIVIATLSSSLWFIPYIHSRTSSENLCGSLFFLGVAIMVSKVKPIIKNPLRQSVPDNHCLISGLLMGLAFMTRYQVGIMIFGLIIWVLFIAKLTPKSTLLIFLGGFAGVFIGFVTDTWAYGEMVFTPWRYFYQNLIVGNSATFGDHPWWKYLYWLARELPPLSTILMVLVLIAWAKFRSHLLTWTTLPIFFVHLFFQNKATRFLFPILPAIPILVYMGYSTIAYFLREKMQWIIKPTLILCLILNSLALLAVSLRPATRAYPFYKHMYENSAEYKKLHYAGEGPYEMLGLPLNYYRHSDLELEKYTNWEQIKSKIISANGEKFLIFSRKFALNEKLSISQEIQCEFKYSSVPQWLLNFNINDWVSRSRIWSLYICSLKVSR